MTEADLKTWFIANLYGPSKAQAAQLAARLFKRWSPPEPPDPYGWRSRIDSYEKQTKFPGSLFVAADGRLVGTWIMGNDYQVKSKYYGGYPNTYLRRVRAMFPDKGKALHLFSGMVDTEVFDGDTVDVNPELCPTYLDDAQSLTRVPLPRYDIVLCDPPYAVEDAERYMTSMVKRKRVFDTFDRLKPGTHIVWLDQVLPMWRKDILQLTGVVGLVRSSNHRFRVMSVFERL